MNRTMRALAAALGLSLLVPASLVPPAFGRPITPAERRESPLMGDMAACDDPFVLKQIGIRFGESEREYWASGLEITGFRDVRESGYRSDGYDYVPRRYCTATAAFTDLKERKVVYWVGKDLWFAGYGSLAEWCIVGLDRNHAYDASCRAARP